MHLAAYLEMSTSLMDLKSGPTATAAYNFCLNLPEKF